MCDPHSRHSVSRARDGGIVFFKIEIDRGSKINMYALIKIKITMQDEGLLENPRTKLLTNPQ